MTTTNHTSPSGEDAANGAIGERPIDEEDAFQDWWKTRKGKNTNAYHGWMARAALTAERDEATTVYNPVYVREQFSDYQSQIDGLKEELATVRATLTAEKVAAQDQSWLPVINREFLGRVVREAWVKWAQQQSNPKPSWLAPYDELSEVDKEADRQIGEAVTQWVLSIKSATWEVTAEKVAAEPVAIVRDNPDDIGTIIEATRPLEVGTQLYLAAAPQPAQTQVALTAAPRYREWLHLTQVGMWTAGVPTWARDHDGRMNDGIAMRSVIEELAALLAAQPVSGWKS
jgi:hypothetical protein